MTTHPVRIIARTVMPDIKSLAAFALSPVLSTQLSGAWLLPLELGHNIFFFLFCRFSLYF